MTTNRGELRAEAYGKANSKTRSDETPHATLPIAFYAHPGGTLPIQAASNKDYKAMDR